MLRVTHFSKVRSDLRHATRIEMRLNPLFQIIALNVIFTKYKCILYNILLLKQIREKHLNVKFMKWFDIVIPTTIKQFYMLH